MRDTSIRPKTVNGMTSKPDVDIIVVTSYGLDDDPKAVLEGLRDILAEEYELDDKPHQRSVGLITEHVEIDVVPIIAPYGDYGPFYLADKKAGWQQTDPARHTTWSTEVNKAVDGRFKPLVKLFKWWRRESPGRFKRPKGFVLETVAAECMNRSEKRYPRTVPLDSRRDREQVRVHRNPSQTSSLRRGSRGVWQFCNTSDHARIFSGDRCEGKGSRCPRSRSTRDR